MEHQQVSGGGPAARAARAVTQARIVESVVERLVVVWSARCGSSSISRRSRSGSGSGSSVRSSSVRNRCGSRRGSSFPFADRPQRSAWERLFESPP